MTGFSCSVTQTRSRPKRTTPISTTQGPRPRSSSIRPADSPPTASASRRLGGPPDTRHLAGPRVASVRIPSHDELTARRPSKGLPPRRTRPARRPVTMESGRRAIPRHRGHGLGHPPTATRFRPQLEPEKLQNHPPFSTTFPQVRIHFQHFATGPIPPDWPSGGGCAVSNPAGAPIENRSWPTVLLLGPLRSLARSTPPVTRSPRPRGVVTEPVVGHRQSQRPPSPCRAAAPRRGRTAPRVVKRTISNDVPRTAGRRLRSPGHDITIRIDILIDSHRDNHRNRLS